MKKNKIRNIRGRFTVEDMTTLAASLIKCGYTVRITMDLRPGTKVKVKVKEPVVGYWEDGKDEST